MHGVCMMLVLRFVSKVRVTVGFGLTFGLTNESAFSGFRTHECSC